MACDYTSIASLLNDGRCFVSMPLTHLKSIEIVLLCRINQALDSMASCDPNVLLEQAGCLNGIPKSKLDVVIAQLLCNISSTIAGGILTGQIKEYTADPTVEGVAPDNQNEPAFCYPSGGVGTVYTWNTTTHVWQ